ncbi:MAG: hypothetical protein OM95_08930 [Bdellovibrio sp. ArHS]|nr:MAG: hypothetical protein OM95_08930 [Bdellovibrio sp. ArHS]
MIVNTVKESRSVAAKSDFNSLVNTIQATLNNTSNCLKAFGGAGAVQLGAYPLPLSLDIGGKKIEPGKYGNALSISKLELTGALPGEGTRQWLARMNLTVNRGNNAGMAVGGAELSKVFDVLITVDESNKIIGCASQNINFWVTTDVISNVAYLAGSVGIGLKTSENVTASLDVKGEFKSNLFRERSDARLKQNVREIASPLERVLKLHGVRYNWKKDFYNRDADQLGLLAQEVEKVFPEAVRTDPVTGTKTVAYENLLAPMVEAIKERQKIIQRQQDEIEEIKRQLVE